MFDYVQISAPAEISWFAWLSLIVQASGPLIAVFLTYKITTKKEANDRVQRVMRASEASPYILQELQRLNFKMRDFETSDSKLTYRELDTALRSLSDFCDLAMSDVYHTLSKSELARFNHLKRISYHFRDASKAIADELSNSKTILNCYNKIVRLNEDISGRLDLFERENVDWLPAAKTSVT